jgi:hypothetical protein
MDTSIESTSQSQISVHVDKQERPWSTVFLGVLHPLVWSVSLHSLAGNFWGLLGILRCSVSWKEASVLAQLRTGMARLNGYLYRINVAESDQCACCRVCFPGSAASTRLECFPTFSGRQFLGTAWDLEMRASPAPDWHGETRWIPLSNQRRRVRSVCMWTSKRGSTVSLACPHAH